VHELSPSQLALMQKLIACCRARGTREIVGEAKRLRLPPE
jgi:hypothetical protein